MQTFLPVADFEESAKILDYRRLGQQRREALMLLGIVTSKPYSSRWRNQPLVMMWREYPEALMHYYNTMVVEWINRGYNNTMKVVDFSSQITMPLWLGLEKYHSSHRAALLAKLPSFYKQYNWKEEPKIGYYWPIKNIR